MTGKGKMNRIKELRKHNGIRQIELCEELEISQGTLSFWENGVCEPDQKNLLKLRDKFNVSVDYLLGFTDDPAIVGNSVSNRSTLWEPPPKGLPNEVLMMAYKLRELDPKDFTALKTIITGLLNGKKQ
jgi:transcriptional regulator with XRE-family HTH domain